MLKVDANKNEELLEATAEGIELNSILVRNKHTTIHYTTFIFSSSKDNNYFFKNIDFGFLTRFVFFGFFGL